MRFPIQTALLILGLVSSAGGVAVAQSPAAPGRLELSLVGNGKICARMHEDIVVEMMSEKQARKFLYTTFAYRFRLFAVKSDTGKEVALFDSEIRPTSVRRGEKVKTPARNPLPHSAGTERKRTERDYWVKQNACRSFARRSEFPLQSGTYVLRLLYQVMSPNGTWYTQADDTGSTWEIRPGETTSQRFQLLDDGNRRDFGFLDRPATPPPADGDQEKP